MAFGITRGLNFTIAANVTGAINSLNSMIKTLQSAQNAALVAGGAFAGLGAAILGSAISAASAFEDQMTELAKVTDPSVVNRMSDSIFRLSEKIPIATSALSDIAIQFGRAGVSGAKELTRLTKVAGKMAIATDLSAKKATTALVKLQAVFETSADEAEALGSVINKLSNVSVASSSQISRAAIRSSAALSNLGLSADQVLALNAAFIKVSPSARRAGTRLRRLGEEVSTLAGKDLQTIAKALGTTGDQIEKMTNSGEGAKELLLDLANATNTASKELSDAFGTRVLTGLQNLSKVTEDVRFKMILASEEMERVESLQREFDRQMRTTSSRMQILSNQTTKLAAKMGKALLPAVKGVVDVFSSIVDALPAAVTRFGSLTAAIGGTATVVTGLISKFAELELAATTLFGVGGAIGLGVAVLAELAIQLSDTTDSFLSMDEIMRKTSEDMTELNKKVEEFKNQTLDDTATKVFKVDQATRDMGSAFGELSNKISKARETGEEFAEFQDSVTFAPSFSGGEFERKMERGIAKANNQVRAFFETIQDTRKEGVKLTGDIDELVNTFESLQKEGVVSEQLLNQVTDVLSKQQIKLKNAAEATVEFIEANTLAKLSDEERKRAIKTLNDALEDLKKTLGSARKTTRARAKARIEEIKSLRQQKRSLGDPIRLLEALSKDKKTVDNLQNKIQKLRNSLKDEDLKSLGLSKEFEKTKLTIRDLNDSLRRGKRLIGRDIIGNLKSVKSEVQGVIDAQGQSFDQLLITQNKVSTAIKQAEDRQEKLVKLINQGPIGRKQEQNELLKITVLLDELKRLEEKLAQLKGESVDSRRKGVKTLNQLVNKTQQAIQANTGLKGAANKASDAVQKLASEGRIADLQEFLKKVKEIQRQLEEGEIGAEEAAKKVDKAFDQIKGKAKETASALNKQLSGSISRAMGEEFRKVIVDAKDAGEALEDIAKEVAQQLFEILVIKQGIKAGLQAGFSQLGLTTTRQHGGRLRKGQTAVVGEKGPELFTPSTSGRVMSHEESKKKVSGQGGGQTIFVEQNNTFQTDVKKDVRQQMNQFLPELERRSVEAVKQTTKRGGSDQDTIRGR